MLVSTQQQETGRHKQLPKSKNSQKTKKLNKKILLVMASIFLPIAIIVFNTVIEQQGLIRRMFRFDRTQLQIKLDQTLIKIQKEIQHNKITLSFTDFQQRANYNSNCPVGLINDGNCQLGCYQQLFLEQLKQLGQKSLKYFKLVTQFDQALPNKSECGSQAVGEKGFQIQTKQQIQLIKQIEQNSDSTLSIPNPQQVLSLSQQIIFKIVFFNFNYQQKPMTPPNLKYLKQKFIQKIARENSLLSYILDQSSKQQNSEVQQTQQIKQRKIRVVFKSSHISQIDQNYHKKINQVFQFHKNKYNNIKITTGLLKQPKHSQTDLIQTQIEYKQKTEQTRKDRTRDNQGNENIEYYLQQLFDQVLKTNQIKQCDYLTHNTNCKQFRVIVLHQSNRFIDALKCLNYIQEEVSIQSNKKEMRHTDLSSGQNLFQYYQRQDVSMSLFTFHPQLSQKQLKQLLKDKQIPTQSSLILRGDLNRLYSKLLEVIYDNLNISPLILLQNSRKHMSCGNPNYNGKKQYVNTQSNQRLTSEINGQVQNWIKRIIRLNQLYKYKQMFSYVKAIQEDKQVQYQFQEQGILNFIKLMGQNNFNSQINELAAGKIKFRNSELKRILGGINKIDPFPSDYKIGALIPIAILLLYPLFSLFLYLTNLNDLHILFKRPYLRWKCRNTV